MTTDELARKLADAELDLKEALVRARIEAGLSQTDLAELMGVNRSTVSRMERLDSNPRLSDIRQYAFWVGAEIDYRISPSDRSHTGSPVQAFRPAGTHGQWPR